MTITAAETRDVETGRPARAAVPRALLSASAYPTARELGFAGLRLALGLMVFSVHGVHKAGELLEQVRTGAPSRFLDEVVAMGVPVPTLSASLAAAAQLVGGLLVAAGLFTRPAAAALAATLLGAVAQNRSAARDPQLAVLYTLAALAFAAAGGGRYSVDAWLFDRGTGAGGTTATPASQASQ